MKIKMHLLVIFSLTIFLGWGIQVNAQTSTDTNQCFSINQSYYTANGYRAPYSQIYLSDGTTLTIKNQSIPSILEDFVYSMGVTGTSNCSASNLVPHISSLPAQATISTVPWSNSSAISFGNGVTGTGNTNAYMTYHFLPSSSVASYQTNYTNYVKTVEDTIINSIDKDHALTLSGDIGGTKISSSLAMTNCVALSGTGTKKIVFMRVKGWNANLNYYLQLVNSSINLFKSTDPFKKYIDQFSFYADIHEIPQNFGGQQSNGLFNDDGIIDTLAKTTSSCGNSAYEYVLLANVGSSWPNYGQYLQTKTLSFPTNTILINASQLQADNRSDKVPFVVVHESGHRVGALRDEYHTATLSVFAEGFAQVRRFIIGDVSAHNCSSDPRSEFVYNGKWYGLQPSVLLKDCYSIGSVDGSTYYRPSYTSFMNNDGKWTQKFNIISCGYIISGILNENISIANAKKHWEECAALDTIIKDGYTNKLLDAPHFDGILMGANGLPNNFDISGSGFDATGNSIKLIPVATTASIPSNVYQANVYQANYSSFFGIIWNFIKNLIPFAHGQTTGSYYEIDDIPSASGTTATFSVPNSVPDGTYTISVASTNSSWADTSYTITVTGHGAGDTSTALPIIIQDAPMSGPDITIPALATYSCGSGYSLTADNAGCFKPVTTTQTATTTVVASASYYCPSGQAPIYYPQYNYPADLACTGQYTAGFYQASANRSCPTGATGPTYNNVLGTFQYVCVLQPSSSFTPASVLTPTVSYSCPTTYTPSGTNCIPPAPLPSLAITASPISITSGQSSNISWSSTNATACSIKKRGSSWKSGTSGTNVSTGSLTSTTTFSGTCTGTGGTSSVQTIIVTITPPVATTTLPIPTLTLSVSPTSVAKGGSSNMSWSSTNATACTIKKGTTTWKTGVSGTNVSTGSLTSTTTFSGTCTGTGGTSSVQTIIVTIVSPVATTTSVTIPATATYSCLAGYTLNSITHMCSKLRATTRSATIKYSCPAAYTLNAVAHTCTSTVSSVTSSVPQVSAH